MVFLLQVEPISSITRYWFEFSVALDDRYFTLVTNPRFPEGGSIVPKPTLYFANFSEKNHELGKKGPFVGSMPEAEPHSDCSFWRTIEYEKLNPFFKKKS